MAARGKLLPKMLSRLLSDRYFQLPPPKTAGREQFGAAYVHKFIQWARRERPPARPEDILHTATALTSLSIVAAIHRWVLPRGSVAQLIVSGGGARNPLILAQLSAALAGIEVLTSDALGIPADAKEAFAFAILADETIRRKPSNLPRATGARRPAILGKICYPPPR
jgi:anhydro-N-acetylmuramic acid kinase